MENYNTTIQFIKEQIGTFSPTVGVVLGSGLGEFAQNIKLHKAIDYSDIPHFPNTTVQGHQGRLVFAWVGSRAVVVMQGRFHYYEGHPPQSIAYPIRVMKLLGVDTLLLSNAAGGINPSFEVGDLVALNNHINLIPNPLIGANDDRFGVRFPDMKMPYDRELIDKAISLGGVKEGVYVALTGPSLESAAEIRHLQIIGGDMVGMSTAPETIVARHCSMRVFAISVITNTTSSETTHQEVVEQGQRASTRLTKLFIQLIESL